MRFFAQKRLINLGIRYIQVSNRLGGNHGKSYINTLGWNIQQNALFGQGCASIRQFHGSLAYRHSDGCGTKGNIESCENGAKKENGGCGEGCSCKGHGHEHVMIMDETTGVAESFIPPENGVIKDTDPVDSNEKNEKNDSTVDIELNGNGQKINMKMPSVYNPQEVPSLKQIDPAEKLLISFVCKKCNTKLSKLISKRSYHHGVVMIRCEGCKNLHLIADHLGWYDSQHPPGTVVDILKKKKQQEEELLRNKKDNDSK